MTGQGKRRKYPPPETGRRLRATLTVVISNSAKPPRIHKPGIGSEKPFMSRSPYKGWSPNRILLES